MLFLHRFCHLSARCHCSIWSLRCFFHHFSCHDTTEVEKRHGNSSIVSSDCSEIFRCWHKLIFIFEKVCQKFVYRMQSSAFFWSFKLAQFEGIWRTFTLLLNLLAALFQILWLFPSISFSNASKTDVDLFPFFICHYHYHCHCRCTFIVSHAETIVLRAINDSYRVKETSASSDGFMVIVSTK